MNEHADAQVVGFRTGRRSRKRAEHLGAWLLTTLGLRDLVSESRAPLSRGPALRAAARAVEVRSAGARGAGVFARVPIERARMVGWYRGTRAERSRGPDATRRGGSGPRRWRRCWPHRPSSAPTSTSFESTRTATSTRATRPTPTGPGSSTTRRGGGPPSGDRPRRRPDRWSPACRPCALWPRTTSARARARSSTTGRSDGAGTRRRPRLDP